MSAGLGDVEKLFRDEAAKAAKAEDKAARNKELNPFGHGTRVVPADDIKVRAVSGSTAGASSGDFHLYRNQRRIEMSRLAAMDRDAAKADEKREFDRQREERLEADANRTAKKAAKRKRLKAAKQAAKQNAKNADDNNDDNDDKNDQDSNGNDNKRSDNDAGNPNAKRANTVQSNDDDDDNADDARKSDQ